MKFIKGFVIFLSLLMGVLSGSAVGNYAYNELPSGPFETAAINNKGQVAGKTTVDDVGYLTLWLPQADYGLQAGLHTYPIPKTIPGTFNTQTLNEIELPWLVSRSFSVTFLLFPPLRRGPHDYLWKSKFRLVFWPASGFLKRFELT